MNEHIIIDHEVQHGKSIIKVISVSINKIINSKPV